MSETIYIHDDFGNQIPLLDDYGNLSFEVIMLYSEDKLTAADRKSVDDFAATDEMSRDALDGYALTNNSSKTRHQLSEVNAGVQKISGAKAVSTFTPPKNEFDYRKLAAAVTLLVIVAGGTYFGSQFFGTEELAENTVEEKKREPRKEVVRQHSPSIPITDSTINPNSEQPQAENGMMPKSEVSAIPEPKIDEKVLDVIEEAEIADAEFDIAQDDLEDEVNKSTQIKDLFNGQVGASKGNSEAMAKEIEGILSEDAARLDRELAQEQRDKSTELAADERARLQQELERYERLAVESGNQEAARKAEEQAKSADEAKAIYEAEMAAYDQPEEKAAAMNDIVVQEESQKRISSAKAKKASEPNQAVSAQFPGGDAEMVKFIAANQRYTESMNEQNLKGSVVVSFQIDKNGKVFKPKVESGQTGLLSEDALRVVSSMPHWIPARKANGSTVKSARIVTITYGE